MRFGTGVVVKSVLDIGKEPNMKNITEEKLRNHNIIKKTSQFLIYITMSIEWKGLIRKHFGQGLVLRESLEEVRALHGKRAVCESQKSLLIR